MSYQSDIFAAIQASDALTALIGARFAWDIMDGAVAAPYLVAQTISGNGETDLNGTRDLAFPLVQFAAWGISKAECIQIIATLKAELEGVNLPGASNVSLGYAGENSSYDPDTQFYGEMVDYRISATSN